MKNSLIGLVLLSSVSVWADTNTLQNLAGNDIELSSQIQTQKQLKLDDPFAIQLFSNWKALGNSDYTSGQWVELILNKEYDKAMSLLPTIKDKRFTAIKDASELYLLFQTQHYQTFLNKWIELASSGNFLETELGLALDQIAGPKTTKIIFEQGFFISGENSEKLKKIEKINSKVNFSLQALKALRTRENAVGWIGKLDEADPFRLPLAQTAILHYAKEGKLGASGKLLKDVVEPIIKSGQNTEEISQYFITLARLLYKAGAASEAKKYYDLIPESSSTFLAARTEALWAHMKDKDYSRTKGELGTLELGVFSDKFYPEAYLVSAMANIKLCEFSDARASINRFINANRKWAVEIEKNLADPKAQPVTKNFFIQNLERARVSLLNEKKNLESKKWDTGYVQPIESKLSSLDSAFGKEVHSQWQNRKTILETALYKMRFAKIELISRMRQMNLNQKVAGSDEVHQQSAATARNNQLSFPYDGVIWGDELFHMSAAVKNKCIRGN
jgi:outer membrane protein assembly factor BamD (BamD/ComL family)